MVAKKKGFRKGIPELHSKVKEFTRYVHLEKAVVGRGTKCIGKMILNCMGMCSREFKTLLFCFLDYGGRGLQREEMRLHS